MQVRKNPHRGVGEILSLFINNKLGVFAVFFISAHKDEFHICHNAEATVTAEFTFELTAEICGVIIEEFYNLTVGKSVFKIDEAAGQHIKVFYLGQALDVKQGIELAYKLILEFFKPFFSAKLLVFLKKIKGIFTVGITPAAVILVKSAVLFMADIAVINGHTATFTDKLSR